VAGNSKEERDRLNAMKFEELRQEIQAGVDQADRGELVDGPEVFAKLRTKIRAKSGNGRDK
jgi:predicted transcriptional regulator